MNNSVRCPCYSLIPSYILRESWGGEGSKFKILSLYECQGFFSAIKLWPRHAVKGTAGADVIEQLKPHKQDYVISKTYYSCFYKTSLDKLLKKLKTNHLIITGVVTNICILYTTAEAYMRGYKVTIPKNCVAALTKDEHRFALQQRQHVFHAEIV